jgi:hypothetical protein
MASQVAHIIYAKRYFDALEENKKAEDLLDEGAISINSIQKINRDEFFLGCVFPDIRRIEEGIKRRDTHLKFPVVNLDFSGLTSFEAGWKFHLYSDMRREEILNKCDFYSLDKNDETYGQAAKLLEDELIYDEYNNWEKMVSYFRNPPIIDTGINISRETFTLWYAILAKYLEEKPTNKAMRIFLSKLKINGDAEKIMETVEQLYGNNKVVEILEGVVEEIV